MTSRIPPSLKWLIDKRARLAAELEKTRSSIATAKSLIADLNELELDLVAIDRTLALHDIQVELENISPISSKYLQLKIPHGELTKSILLCLRLRKDIPTSSSEIMSFVIARHADLGQPEQSRTQLRMSIKNRLNGLYAAGLLMPHHPKETNGKGRWTLASFED